MRAQFQAITFKLGFIQSWKTCQVLKHLGKAGHFATTWRLFQPEVRLKNNKWVYPVFFKTHGKIRENMKNLGQLKPLKLLQVWMQSIDFCTYNYS